MKKVLINSVKRIVTKNGKKRVLINGEHFISAGQFDQAVPQGLSDVNLVGCSVNINYFQEGEELITGEACTESGKLVKDVSIIPSMEAQIAASVAATMVARFGGGGASQSTPAPKAAVQAEESVDTL